MATIVFNNTSDIHQGIDKVALRVFDDAEASYGATVAWNGVTALNEAPSGAETTKLYADNKQYGGLTSKEEFALTLECYCTPSAFDDCDGSVALTKSSFKVGMQSRKKFALVYRELVDDDPQVDSKEGIYHVVIGCKASPSAKDHATINDSPEAQTLSYEISTTPEKALFRESGTGVTEVSDDEVVHFTIIADSSNADDVYNFLYDDIDTWDINSNNQIDFTALFTAAN